jgi:hypothetical protein
MGETVQQTLNRALLHLMRPLTRILLRNGIAYGNFAELAKKTYVDVAFEEFAPSGRKQTVSRVSALTGLTRKETKRLRDLKHADADARHLRYNRAIRVISGWLNDPEFLDADGNLDTLPVEGKRGSFAALVKKYSGDMTTQSMLAVLAMAGSVAREGDRVRLLRHAYVPGSDAADKLHILGTDTAELISTIDHNLVSDADRLRFQRKVSDHRVPPQLLAEFQALATGKAQALLEELDAWLARHQGAEQDPAAFVSVGIYYYQNSEHEEDAR